MLRLSCAVDFICWPGFGSASFCDTGNRALALWYIWCFNQHLIIKAPNICIVPYQQRDFFDHYWVFIWQICESIFVLKHMCVNAFCCINIFRQVPHFMLAQFCTYLAWWGFEEEIFKMLSAIFDLSIAIAFAGACWNV